MKNLISVFVAISLWLYSFAVLATNKIPALDDDEGFVIVTIYSKGYAEKIELNGSGLGDSHVFGPLNNSQYFTIKKMKAGTYQWEKVTRNIDMYPDENSVVKPQRAGYQISDFTEQELNFTVTAGKLNYVGLFMYESNGSKFSAKLLNRTSIILTMVKQDFPEYLKAFEVVNGLYPNDQYIQFYLNQSKPVVQGE